MAVAVTVAVAVTEGAMVGVVGMTVCPGCGAASEGAVGRERVLELIPCEMSAGSADVCGVEALGAVRAAPSVESALSVGSACSVESALSVGITVTVPAAGAPVAMAIAMLMARERAVSDVRSAHAASAEAVVSEAVTRSAFAQVLQESTATAHITQSLLSSEVLDDRGQRVRGDGQLLGCEHRLDARA